MNIVHMAASHHVDNNNNNNEFNTETTEWLFACTLKTTISSLNSSGQHLRIRSGAYDKNNQSLVIRHQTSCYFQSGSFQ